MGRIDAGALRDRVEVLTLEQADGDWSWACRATVWAKVQDGAPGELTRTRNFFSSRNLFSSTGLAADTVLVTMRARPLSLSDALRFNGRHLFLTVIGRPENGYMTVIAAGVKMGACQANPGGAPPGPRFPAALTEKYLKHEQLEPMAVNKICYVLVTPKCVELTPGKLVDVDGAAYQVLVAHVLDPYKNEYEIMRVRDL